MLNLIGGRPINIIHSEFISITKILYQIIIDQALIDNNIIKYY